MINAESFDIPDQVRFRTGMRPLNRGSITSQALLREAIEKKRRVELASENHRCREAPNHRSLSSNPLHICT